MLFATFFAFGFGWLLLPVILYPSSSSSSQPKFQGILCNTEYKSGSTCNSLPCSGPCYSQRLNYNATTAQGLDCRPDRVCTDEACIGSPDQIECVSYKITSSNTFKCVDEHKDHFTCGKMNYVMDCVRCSP